MDLNWNFLVGLLRKKVHTLPTARCFRCYFTAFAILCLLEVGGIQPKVDINIQTKDLNGHHSEKHENKGILQRS